MALAEHSIYEMDEVSTFEQNIMPTLVIGLGGTGAQIIRRLKAKFRQRFGENHTGSIRYLVFDTDSSSFRERVDMANFRRDEFCELALPNPTQLLEEVETNDVLRQAFYWLPTNPKLNTNFFVNHAAGAGLIRPIGRLALFYNRKLVVDYLNNAFNDLSNLGRLSRGKGNFFDLSRKSVYIVGSLAGGTGCGIFLDVAVFVRRIFGMDSRIFGLFALPDCYQQVLAGSRDAYERSTANCYAALKELEYFMEGPSRSGRKADFLFSYLGVWDTVKLQRGLFDVCYLIENKNRKGGILGRVEEVYEMSAQQLFQEIGSPLGRLFRSTDNNDSVFMRMKVCPISRKLRTFSTISTASLIYPWEKVLDYCAARLNLELVKDLFLARYRETEQHAGEPVRFLESQHFTSGLLEERLMKDEGIWEICSQLLAVKPKGKSSREYLQAYDGLLDLWEANRGALKEVLGHCLERITAGAREKLEQKMEQMVFAGGVNYGESFLNKLNGILKGQIEAAVRDIKLSHQREEALEEDREGIRRELLSFNPIAKIIFSSKEEKLRWRLKEIYDQLINEKIRELFLTKFIGAYENLAELTGKLQTAISLAKIGLQKVCTGWESSLSGFQYQGVTMVGDYVLQKDVLDQGYYEKFYLTGKPENPAEYLTAIKLWDRPVLEFLADPELLWQHLDQTAKAFFQDKVRNTTIMDILRDKYGEDAGRGIKKELDIMAELCQPFWTANPPAGEYFSEGFLVGAQGAAAPAELAEWLEGHSDENSRATFVNNEYPYAIDFTRRTHGACAAYLNLIDQYKAAYETFLHQRVVPLHLHPDYESLPDVLPEAR